MCSALALCGDTVVEGTQSGHLVGISLASLQHGYTATCESGAAPLDGLLSWRLALASYLLTVALLLIDVLQLLSFGFDIDTPPSLASLAKELAALQTFGLDAFSPTAVLAAAVAVVLALTALLLAQEAVE